MVLRVSFIMKSLLFLLFLFLLLTLITFLL